MKSTRSNPLVVTMIVLVCSTAQARVWKDALGHFAVEAEVITFNRETVVLKKGSGDLVAVAIGELSKEDQAYIQSKDSTTKLGQSAEEMQTWTARDGMKVRARVLSYGRKELKIQRKNGHIHADDRRFSEIDPLHQKLLLKVLSKLEDKVIDDEKALDHWGKSIGGEPRTFKLEGVLMKLESGDEIGVPFFLFAEDELKVLEPGWKRWLEQANSKEYQEHEDFLVRSQAMAYQQDRAAQRQIEQLKLGMLATATGLVSIWEVRLVPAQGGYNSPISVMVPAANSQVAGNMAMQRYPGFVVNAIRRASG